MEGHRQSRVSSPATSAGFFFACSLIDFAALMSLPAGGAIGLSRSSTRPFNLAIPPSPPGEVEGLFSSRDTDATPLSGGMTVKIKKSYFTDAEASERAEPGPGVSMARSRSAPGSDPDRRHVCKPSIGAEASVLLA